MDQAERDEALDPEMRRIVDALPPAPKEDGVAAMRAHARRARAPWNAGAAAGLAMTRGALPGATGPRPALTLARPDAAQGLPVVHIHGGGWTLCDLDTHLALFAGLARATGRVVVAPHARRAPEHPAPAPLADTRAALRKVAADHPEGFFLSGDSAGANLALAALISAREEGRPLPARAVSLHYGCYRRRFDTESHRAFGDGRFGLSTARMRMFWDFYMPRPAEHADLSGADFGGLPPVQIHAAALDPLRDDSLWLGDRLAAAGAAPGRHVWPGVIHGFLHYSATLEAAEGALAATAAFFGAHA